MKIKTCLRGKIGGEWVEKVETPAPDNTHIFLDFNIGKKSPPLRRYAYLFRFPSEKRGAQLPPIQWWIGADISTWTYFERDVFYIFYMKNW